jgi:hypothetical protein
MSDCFLLSTIANSPPDNDNNAQGGVQEVLMLDPDKPDDLVLYLKKRKGFIKLALTTGSPVVPVFAFNLDGSYRYWLPRGRLVEKISRAIGFAPLVFMGRWGVPFGIPIPRKSHVVIGQGTYLREIWFLVNFVHLPRSFEIT